MGCLEMSELTVEELDLLQRVQAKPELRALFFRKVKGLKWFDPLSDAGYFNAQNIPAPVPSKREGYVSIPNWEVVDYLVKAAQELNSEENDAYVARFIKIISSATAYAKETDFGNYHVWRKFAQIITSIPSKDIPVEFLEVVDYWLDDRYERGLVAGEIGAKFLVKLLVENNDHSGELALRLIEILYKVNFLEKQVGEDTKLDASFRFDHHYAEKITKGVAYLAGLNLGRDALCVFNAKLEEILTTLDNDSWSNYWQPAIEDHEQNKYRDDPENVLIEAYRECLNGFLDSNPEDACDYVAEMIESDFQMIQRLAIHCITNHFLICGQHAEKLIDKKFLRSNYRHEIWHFLNQHYLSFEQPLKDRAIALISEKKRLDDNNELLEGATAYEHATWLSAIKDLGEQEKNLYSNAIAVAKTEPDHPDFLSYSSFGAWGQESPYSVDELSALSVENLVTKLATYESGGGWREPGIEGLVNATKQLIKTSPARYYSCLAKFSNLDLAYVYAIIEAYSDLWTEKASLPWDEVWQHLLEFCSVVVGAETFWSEEKTQQRDDAFVANRYWVVGAIGRLLESGAKSDEHAFSELHHDQAELLIAHLLKNEKGNEFETSSDAVSIAINSPRGRCLEALINLTLRLCRLSDKENDKDHSAVWNKFQNYYDAELDRADNGEYEFITLLTNYLPNFIYMSTDWVTGNLNRIFDQKNYLKWLCAIQGYSYIGTVYQEIYHYLSEHGDLLKVLDDESIKDRVEERAVQQIAIAYINNFESLEGGNSLILTLINRKDFDELRHLIWFVKTLRKNDENELKEKVYALWPRLLAAVDLSTSKGRKLASSLCCWAPFVDPLDEERKALLMAIAPYADESHNSYDLLKSLSAISNTHPFDANEIWLKLLEGSFPDFPEEAIHQILTNLVAQGYEGTRLARETVSKYLKQGIEGPSIWLKKIMDDQNQQGQ